jgi:hypothetical protein
MPIDTGEAKVRHLVKLAQRSQNRNTDLFTWNLTGSGGAQRIFNSLTKLRQIGFANRPAFAGVANPDNQFFSAEWLNDSTLFEHCKLHLLNGGEAALALRALTAAAHRRAIFSDTRVEHPRIGVAAIGTKHLHHLLRARRFFRIFLFPLRAITFALVRFP